MADLRTLANALLEDLDKNGLPGSPIRYHGEEIWLHTTGQVEGWLRTHLEKAGLIEAVEDNWTAPVAPWALKHTTNQKAPDFNSAVKLSTLAGRENFMAVIAGYGGDPVHVREVGAVWAAGKDATISLTLWDGVRVSSSFTRDVLADTPVEVRGGQS